MKFFSSREGFSVNPASTKIAGACLLAAITGTSIASASVVTGNPSSDGGWTEGTDTLDKGTYVDHAGNFSADIYTTAFVLAPTSNLVSTGLDAWNAGDTIVGVGGVFDNTITAAAAGWSGSFSGVNSSIAYNSGGGLTTRIVVKYGASASPSTWFPSTVAPGSGNGVGSLAGGGNGSILLGTNSGDFTPANSGTPINPTDSPLIQVGASQDAGDPGVGKVITAWTGNTPGSTVVAFESFLDLTLLDSKFGPSSATPASVSLGNEFDLDLQQGTNSSLITDALGNLPTSVPEPATVGIMLAASTGLLARRRRSI